MKAGRSLSQCGAMLRRHDPDRYLCCLFADPLRREALFALYAFIHEIMVVRDRVRDPMLGRIRLQWWREGLDGIAEGRPGDHQVIRGLAAAFRTFDLERGSLDALIDFQDAALEQEGPLTLEAMTAEARHTALLQPALRILGDESPVACACADNIAVAWTLTKRLRSVPLFARAGRSALPDDLAASGDMAAAGYRGLRDSQGLRDTVRAVADVAREHVSRARRYRGLSISGLAPVVLPARLVQLYLARLERVGWNAFDPSVGASMPMKPWILWLSVLTRRW